MENGDSPRPPASMPELLSHYWERDGKPLAERRAEAERQAGKRVEELVKFIRGGSKLFPHTASLLAVMAGSEYDQVLLEANVRKVLAEEPIGLELLVQLEKFLTENAGVPAHGDLAKWRGMIDELSRSN